MTFRFSKSHKILVSTLAMVTALSSTAFANGGNNPIEGIDIIMKEDPSQAPIKPVRFGEEELKKLNSLKGMERPALIAGYAAQYAQKQARGAAPKGGWDAVLKKGLIADWNVDERGGSTAIKAATQNANYIVTVHVQSENENKEASQFDEADTFFAKRHSNQSARDVAPKETIVHDANRNNRKDLHEIDRLESEGKITPEQAKKLSPNDMGHCWGCYTAPLAVGTDAPLTFDLRKLSQMNELDSKAYIRKRVEDNFPDADQDEMLEGGSGLIIALLAAAEIFNKDVTTDPIATVYKDTKGNLSLEPQLDDGNKATKFERPRPTRPEPRQSRR